MNWRPRPSKLDETQSVVRCSGVRAVRADQVIAIPVRCPTDGKSEEGKGHAVIKFSPDGNVLMTLGKPVAGDGPDTFNTPSDVLVAPNGDIFVADDHGEKSNARIVKFTSNGKFIKAWGKAGSAPGECDVSHGLAMESSGRSSSRDESRHRRERQRPQIDRRFKAILVNRSVPREV